MKTPDLSGLKSRIVDQLTSRIDTLRPAAARLWDSARRWRPASERRPAADGSLAVMLRPWQRLGWGVVVAFLGGSVLWAAQARLDAAAIAPGVVGVETNRKTVQHLEGGIIEEIRIAEGDHVDAGEILVVFDATYARASLDMLTGQHDAALALQARLVAERDGKPEIRFPESLMRRADDPKVSEVIVGQIDIFESRRARIANQESILRERIAKHRQEIAGLRAQAAAGRRQLELLAEEIETAEELLKEGLITKSRLLALKRNAAEITGDVGDYAARIARAEESIAEVRLQLTLPRNRHMNQVTEMVQEVQGRIADLEEKIRAARDVLSRTAVTAPVAGIVVDLQVHTPGGVVQPGQTLMDLVPDRDRLVVQARVHPRDIDAVFVDMPARVRLSAFNARTTPPLEGVVTSVSADRVTDPATGVPYFAVRVVPRETPGFDLAALKPGMQAEVFLVTAERTALDYVLEPVTRSFERAGRER